MLVGSILPIVEYLFFMLIPKQYQNRKFLVRRRYFDYPILTRCLLGFTTGKDLHIEALRIMRKFMVGNAKEILRRNSCSENNINVFDLDDPDTLFSEVDDEKVEKWKKKRKKICEKEKNFNGKLDMKERLDYLRNNSEYDDMMFTVKIVSTSIEMKHLRSLYLGSISGSSTLDSEYEKRNIMKNLNEGLPREFVDPFLKLEAYIEDNTNSRTVRKNFDKKTIYYHDLNLIRFKKKKKVFHGPKILNFDSAHIRVNVRTLKKFLVGLLDESKTGKAEQ